MIFAPQPLTPACRLWQFKEHLPENKSMYWLYDTYGHELNTDYNKGCYDVSKSRVHKIHEKALGYSVKIDPLSYGHPFLEKPERQCMHHLFKIHTEPCEPKEGFVYERLLENTFEIRYFFCRTGTDFKLLKTRNENDFSHYTIMGIDRDKTRSDFVLKFADLFGLDFAELDILHDGKTPYITDVNNVAGMGMTRDKFKHPETYDRLNELYIEQIKTL